MIEILLSLIGGLKGLIVGGLGLLGGIFAFYYKTKFNRERQEKEEYRQANRMHEAKEEVHRQDQATDATVEQQINEVRDRVDKAPNQEEAANEMGQVLNDYFNSGK
jgi:uncharacterized protein YpuA (DUF1002 family)